MNKSKITLLATAAERAVNRSKLHRFFQSTLLVMSLLVLPGAWITVQAAEKNEVSFTESQLEALIDKRVEERMKEILSNDEFLDARIEQGILDFIARQQAQNDPSVKARNARPVDPASDHIYGNPSAEVSLIEYSDYECPFCKTFHPTAHQMVAEFDGKVNWVYRHFPLEFHNPGAQKQAEAAECAGELGGNEAFWRYSDLIYERTESNGNGFPVSDLVPLAVEIGLNKSEFTTCFDSERYRDRVKDDYADGARAGVSGTPGNILRNNKTGNVVVIPGAQPFTVVKQAVERLLDQ